MFLRIWQKWRAMQDRKRSMGWMMNRQDDRWMEDIGITRNDLRQLLNNWED